MKIKWQMKMKNEIRKELLMRRIALLIAGIYIIFLTSRAWYPAHGDYVPATAVFEEQKYESYAVALERWEYSEADQKMEVFISLKNNGIVDLELDYTAMERTYGEVEVTVAHRGLDYVVLQIPNMNPRWRELSLRINAENASEPLKLYTNEEKVTKVPRVRDRSVSEYEKTHLALQISANEKLIAQKEKELRNVLSENEKIAARKVELVESLELKKMTEEEREETNAMIAQAEGTIKSNEQMADKIKEDIQAIEEKNTFLLEEMEERGEEK